MRGIKCFSLQPAHTWQCTQSKGSGRRSQKRKGKAETSRLKKETSKTEVNGGGMCSKKKKHNKILIIYNTTASFYRNHSVYNILRPILK